VHVAEGKEEGSLLLTTSTPTNLEASSTPVSPVVAISSRIEIELKEEKVYVHLDKEKECDAGTCVIDTREPSTCLGVEEHS
jgi:hypothetical protein